MAKRYPGEITLIAVGPLDNVADALRLEPNLGKYLKRAVFMNGCVYGTAGKPSTPVAEFNTRASTRDSQLVYAAGLPLTIVPLDSTTRVRLGEEERAAIRKYDSPLTRSLEALYRLWISSPEARMTMHDQLAVVEAARAGLFFETRRTLNLRVDDAGFTTIDPKGKPVTVCLEPRRDEFVRYYIEELTSQKLRR